MDMDSGILTQLLDTTLEMKADVSLIRERQDRTIQDHEETKTALNAIDVRLHKMESKVNEAAMTWKITKRVAVGMITLIASAVTFNWAGVKSAWLFLFHA